MDKITWRGIIVGLIVGILLSLVILIGYKDFLERNSPISPPQYERLSGCNGATTTSCEELERIANLPPEPLPMLPVPTTSANPVQSGRIDEHLFVDNTLRVVDFCGKKYLVKQVIIDGVDVIQRVAYLFNSGEALIKEDKLMLCSNLELSPPIPKLGYRLSDPYELEMGKVELRPNYSGNTTYSVFLAYSFTVELPSYKIYATGGIGERFGPIGHLK